MLIPQEILRVASRRDDNLVSVPAFLDDMPLRHHQKADVCDLLGCDVLLLTVSVHSGFPTREYRRRSYGGNNHNERRFGSVFFFHTGEIGITLEIRKPLNAQPDCGPAKDSR